MNGTLFRRRGDIHDGPNHDPPVPPNVSAVANDMVARASSRTRPSALVARL